MGRSCGVNVYAQVECSRFVRRDSEVSGKAPAGTAFALQALLGQRAWGVVEMPDTEKKLDELQAVMALARHAAGKDDTASAARIIEEMHIQTGILLRELRRPTMPGAKIYNLAAERCARA